MGEELRMEGAADSAVSSCVRFAERMAAQLAAGKVVMGLDRKELAWERLCPAEAARLYPQVSALVAGGMGRRAACEKVGVTLNGWRLWVLRSGQRKGRAGA